MVCYIIVSVLVYYSVMCVLPRYYLIANICYIIVSVLVFSNVGSELVCDIILYLVYSDILSLCVYYLVMSRVFEALSHNDALLSELDLIVVHVQIPAQPRGLVDHSVLPHHRDDLDLHLSQK